ncbi:MAG: hypothetical protein KBT39_03920 [Bacteroidales bacterium]|nr:hypothetical protein [Bacteroidales bacterium]
MKAFNTAGTCRPNEHYMVDITERLGIIRKMVVKGDYFCINRGRQYGKTATLKAISSTLSNEYCIFNISFETVEDACFKDENRLYAKFISLVARSFMWTPLEGLDSVVAEMIVESSKEHKTGYMVSFCFNKNKQSGLLPPVELNSRTLIEAIV